jgi:hypothetical protein
MVMSESNNVLTVAIATIGCRIGNLRNFYFDPCVNWIIVWQKPADNIDLSWLDRDGVRLIKNLDIGVARSRNEAIKECATRWLWFADDDISYLSGTLSEVSDNLGKLDDQSYKIIITSVADSKGYIWKRPVSFNRLFFYPSISGVGTIQIIVDVNFVRKKGIYFPIDMGLGSKYPACDEPVFLGSLLSVGAKATCWKSTCVVHPIFSSGSNWEIEGAAEARGQLIRRLYGAGWLGLSMLILFVLRSFASGMEYKNSLKAMRRIVAGYLEH